MKWLETAHEGEKRAAIGAGGRWKLGEVRGRFADFATDQSAHQQTSLAGCATEPSEVTDPHETLRKHMSEEAMEEGVDL